MRPFITRIFLLAILISTSPSALWAQNVGDHHAGGGLYTRMTKAFHGICGLLSVENHLTSDEGLGTEGAPDLGGSVPVDGGVSLLLAAGAAYGLRRLRAGRK